MDAGHRTDRAASPLHRFRHDAMACTWGLVVQHARRQYAEQVARVVFDEIDRLERELSRFRSDSDVARINALPPGQRLRVGADVFECLRIAERANVVTRGAFDVTLGALLPKPSDARRERQLAGDPPPFGQRSLALDPASKSVSVRIAGLSVDLGGIGKGFAIDRAVELLREWGISAAMLDSGQSSAYAIGVPLLAIPGQDAAWRIEIRDPADANRSLGVLRLQDQAVSGSGAALHGRHILDPRSGNPAVGAVAAWAMAGSAAMADALSTALMVLSRADADATIAGVPDASGLQLWDDGHHRTFAAQGCGFATVAAGGISLRDGPTSGLGSAGGDNV